MKTTCYIFLMLLAAFVSCKKESDVSRPIQGNLVSNLYINSRPDETNLKVTIASIIPQSFNEKAYATLQLWDKASNEFYYAPVSFDCTAGETTTIQMSNGITVEKEMLLSQLKWENSKHQIVTPKGNFEIKSFIQFADPLILDILTSDWQTIEIK